MKRYFDFFRIKLILVIMIIVFPIVFIVILVNTMTEDYSDCSPDISVENAPENTAYVDILVKLPENSEYYVDFAEWEEPPKKLIGYEEVTRPVYNGKLEPTSKTRTYTEPVYEELSITPDSEIARLNADGFVSLSIHYANSKGFSGTSLYLDHGWINDIREIKKRYGKFKAAYVDENGNVLGITKASRTRYEPQEPSSFSADGDKLVFTKWGVSPPVLVLMFVSFFGAPTAVVLLIVCIVLGIIQDKRLSKIQE